MNKEHIRKELLQKMFALSQDELLQLNRSLTHQLIHLLHSLPELHGQTGAGYLPLKGEVFPDYQELIKTFSIQWSFPVLVDGRMSFGLPEGEHAGSTWLKGSYHEIKPDWILVPGVGFDLKGARLGRGKGFYDRFLENYAGPKIAVCWSGQIEKEIPVESHDCHMDYLITESFCWDVKQQKRL